jgi:polyisoprenyl-teichoic acid--peptidoglycan teichoic acid transferase
MNFSRKKIGHIPLLVRIKNIWHTIQTALSRFVQKSIIFLSFYRQKRKTLLAVRKTLAQKFLRIILFTIFGIFFLITGALASVLWKVSDVVDQKPLDVIKMVGGANNLQHDAQGNINILLLGRGGGNHDGADLTDVFMIASISPERKTVSLLSIPRDLWVNRPNHQGTDRINTIFDWSKRKYRGDENKALENIVPLAEKMTNLDIQYFAIINFHGFIDFVEALGGIDVHLTEDFGDLRYPKADWSGWETFWLPKGTNHLTGYNALKFVRSRHSSSDFSRAKRQQMVLQSIKEQMLSLGFLNNPKKIQSIFDIIQNSLVTNLTTEEIFSLGILAKNIASNDIFMSVLNNSCIMEDNCYLGGFLYNPERQFFGGASVLLPVGANIFHIDNYEKIHTFANLFFFHPEIYKENPKIHIYNGTKRAGKASKLQKELLPYGFQIPFIGSAENRSIQHEKTVIYVPYPQLFQQSSQALGLFVNAEIREGSPPPSATLDSNADIYIIIGKQ